MGSEAVVTMKRLVTIRYSISKLSNGGFLRITGISEFSPSWTALYSDASLL